MHFERMTIDHFWDSIVTTGNLPIRKSGAMTSILRDAMKGMYDNMNLDKRKRPIS
jgi:hypothetical protein